MKGLYLPQTELAPSPHCLIKLFLIQRDRNRCCQTPACEREYEGNSKAYLCTRIPIWLRIEDIYTIRLVYRYPRCMKRLKFALIVTSVFAIGIGGAVNAQSATTYTLNLMIIDKDADKAVSLYDDDPLGNQDVKHGIKVCSDPESWYFKPNRDTYDTEIIKYLNRITTTTKIKVKSDTGRIVGLGSLSKVGWKKDREEDDEQGGLVVYGTCTYSKAIKVSKSNFYSIEFSGTNLKVPAFDIAFTDLVKMKWKLTLKI